MKVLFDLKKSIFNRKNKYSNCINQISDSGFSEENINNCIGENLQYFYLDCSFEMLKIKSRIASRIKKIIKNNCTSLANNNKSDKVVCEDLSANALEMMWNDFNFHRYLLENQEQFLFTRGAINE